MLPCRNRHSLARLFSSPTSQSISMCQTDVSKRKPSALSPCCLSFSAPSYFSRGCWESQAKNEFVAADLVMMCTMMRAGLLRFPPSFSLTRLIFLYRSSSRARHATAQHARDDAHTHPCGRGREEGEKEVINTRRTIRPPLSLLGEDGATRQINTYGRVLVRVQAHVSGTVGSSASVLLGS